ncbi:AMP-binding protein [Polaromonas sp.]|uniref:AMP-binding protein n=1 Tax=Polaromonas sp. TaxID=1869339 RepID=UPI003BAB68EE
MSREWNFADVWEAVAQAAPDSIAQAHGTRRIAWREFDAQANGMAWTLLQAGCQQQDKVALYLHNGPEYLQSAFGCMKVALVPVNTNYRYQQDELHYLWDNADAVAVVFHGAFTSTVDAMRARCGKVRLWIHVDDGSMPCPDWAVPFEASATSHPAQVEAAWGRSGDDQVLIYTGGTTGRPRGVMWRQHDLYVASNTTGDPEQVDLACVRKRIAAMLQNGLAPPVGLPAAPLMHGTAYVFAGAILTRGGTVTTLTSTQFDVDELLTAIEAGPVTDLCIVGDAFCRPMVDALDAAPGRWNLAGLKAVSSSGMMWSNVVKARLLEHAPNAVLIDFLNSSEASGMGRAIASKERTSPSARFKLGKNAFVIDADNQPVAPGSGIAGRVAVRGNVPLGYYGDPEKSAATFPIINGVRCAVPGDFAMVEADGSITLLGRGSVSINTGGEKVFPEEVEECIKLLPEVRDAVVVGVPDERFGETVAALVEAVPGQAIDTAAVTEHVRTHLARHKAPRHVMVVASIGRGPNGKADYMGLKKRVADWLQENAAAQAASALEQKA